MIVLGKVGGPSGLEGSPGRAEGVWMGVMDSSQGSGTHKNPPGQRA